MKRILTIGAILMAATTLTSCGMANVSAGNVGVRVQRFGDEKGGITVEGPGRYWLTWNEDMFIFPTFTQNYVWTADSRPGSETDESFSFQDKDGLVANADIGVSYAIKPDMVGTVFAKYRRGVDEITDTFLRNMIRDALVREASTKSVEYLYGAGKAEIMDKVQATVKEQVEPLGIQLEKVYWIGEIRLTPEVQASINAKIAATQMSQQRQNEVATARADADKKIEEARGTAESITAIARAQAEANRILSESLTDQLIKNKAIEKWDGVLPKITGGESSLLVDTKSITGNQ